MTVNMPPSIFSVLGLMPMPPVKRSIFVSFHHAMDQAYYDTFSTTFSETYGIIKDNSIERCFDSDNTDYVMQRIRDKHITGTSCTIVLCGPVTPLRKYVDWEIKATLDRQHGLIGINLPTNPVRIDGKVYVPDRLHDNIVSGYATWMTWGQLTQGGPALLKTSVEAAIAKPKTLIKNWREMRSRNG